MTTIQIDLPEATAEAARDAGLLTSQSLAKASSRKAARSFFMAALTGFCFGNSKAVPTPLYNGDF